ncbi:hypothetical protein D3C71_911010 [compost metagenome]
MDTHGTAAHFITVDHHIVGVRHGLFRCRFQFARGHVFRRGERVVHCRQAAFTVFFKHWEINHPQRSPFGFVGQAQVFTQFEAQCAQRVGNHFLVVSAEEEHVAVLCASALKNRFHDVCVQEFRHRAGDPFDAFRTFGDFNISQAFRAVDFHEIAVVINLFTAQACATRNTQGSHAAFRIVSRAGEDGKFDCFQQVSDVHQLHRVTQVGFVRAVTTLCFCEGHDREIAQIHTFHVLPQTTYQRFHDFAHLWCGHEGSLDVDLGKFRLTVSAQVFVAEAFHDLIVAIETGHHQQLFEQLWRLRQRVEFAFMYA